MVNIINKHQKYANVNFAPKKHWTEDEDAFILQAHDKLSDRELAKELGRTLESTRTRRKRLRGIRALNVPKEIFKLTLGRFVFILKREDRV